MVWWAVVQWHERAQYKAETFAFSRIYCNIRKPLMPIRYPIAFRGTARPSVCSAWRLKVPKIEHLTHPKPYIVPKSFDCFSLICSSRNLMSCRNSVLCRNLLIVSALFAQGETLYRAENSVFFRNLLLVSVLFVQVETLYRAETRCFSETFCLFMPYLFK